MDYPQITGPGYRPWQEVPARRPYYDAPLPVLPEKSDSVTLGQLLKPVRRSPKTLVLFALGGLLLGLAVAIPQKPVYQARTQIEIRDFNDNYLNMKDVNPGLFDHAMEPYIQTQMRLLQSDSLLERVAERLHLTPDTRADRPGAMEQFLRRVHLSVAPVPGREQFLRSLAAPLSVRTVGDTRIVEVLYESPDPQFATNFVNTLSEEFINQGLQRRVESTQQTGQLLSSQIRDLKSNLERSEEQLQSYARANNLMYAGDNDHDSVAELRLRQLQEKLTLAQDERVAAQARYNRALASPVEGLPEVQDDAGLRENQARLTDLKRQLAELTATYTPSYYKVKELKAQIAELSGALESGRANILKRIKNQYDAAATREKMLSDLYASQTGVVSNQSGKAVRYNMLKSEVETNRLLYQSMLQKVREAGIASGIRASNVQVVDPATVPQYPVRPNVRLHAAVGLLMGTFFGIAFVFLRKREAEIIQAPGDISLHLNYPELGAIPDAGRHVGSGAGLPRLLRTRTPGEDDHALELVSWQHKHSPVAESFRAALASVLFSGPKGEWPRVIVITSSCPAEGKTVVACNFAITLAETNHRVLLIDGDLRRPRLHNVFNLENSRGFADLLRDTAPVKNYPVEALGEKTEIPGLYVLPSGPNSVMGSNLLYSPRAAELMQRLRREFHAIVIDTPPLSMSDARGLGRLADGVALVVRADRTSQDIAMASLRRLSEDGTWVLGTILNSWDTRKASAYQPYHQYT